jgi:hypothetical protein
VRGEKGSERGGPKAWWEGWGGEGRGRRAREAMEGEARFGEGKDEAGEGSLILLMLPGCDIGFGLSQREGSPKNFGDHSKIRWLGKFPKNPISPKTRKKEICLILFGFFSLPSLVYF